MHTLCACIMQNEKYSSLVCGLCFSVLLSIMASCSHRTESLVTQMLSWYPSVVCTSVIAIASLMLYNLMPHMGYHSVTGRSYNGSHPHKCHGMYIAITIAPHNCIYHLIAGPGQPGALPRCSVPTGLVAQNNHWSKGGQGSCGLWLWGSGELGIRGSQAQLQQHNHHHHSQAMQLRGPHHHLRTIVWRPRAEEGWLP